MDPPSKSKNFEVDHRAYRFFPNEKQQKTSFDKNGTRFFFYGQIQHDQFEKKKIGEFEEFLFQNDFKINRDFWNVQKILQVIQGNGYKNEQAYQAIKAHQQFRADYLGVNNVKVQYQPVAYLINSGIFYPCGRDKYFRPILVFNCKKIDLKDFQSSLKATIFVQEQVIQNLLLPGQVQNWDIVYDLGGMGITEIPTGVLKSMLQKMSSNYGGRLYRLWVVNAPMTVAFSWKVVSAFLDQVTVDKIKISRSNTDKDMWTICDKSQIQQKYGGTQPNKENYYPFQLPQGIFEQSRLISEQKYQQKLQNGQLKHNKINPKYL